MWECKFGQGFVRCGALALHSSGLQDVVKRDRQRLDADFKSYPWLFRRFLIPLREGALEHEGLRRCRVFPQCWSGFVTMIEFGSLAYHVRASNSVPT